MNPTESDVMKLEGRELDVQIALVTGYRLVQWNKGAFLLPPDDHPSRGAYPADLDAWDCETPRFADYMSDVPAYHSSLDAVRPVVEKAVEEFGVATLSMYLTQVLIRTDDHRRLVVKSEPVSISDYFILASPAQISKAVLLASLRKEEVPNV